MNILILNWRDIKNPQSGGAEILTHELAKRMVGDGQNVIQFSSRYKNSKASEMVDGVKIIRRGNPDARTLFSSVHYEAYKYYKKNLKGKVDLVIDEVHGIPFFTPLYVKEKKVVLICEVAGKLWDVAVKFPFNFFGKSVEKIYPFLYKNLPVITISNSSKNELVDLGFSKKSTSVIKLGCDTPIISNPKKNKFPTLIFVGRLTRQKGIEDAILVTSILKKSFPRICLWVIGRGQDRYVRYLNELIKKSSLEQNVKLWGFVEDDEKNKLLEKSHVLISPSAKEGWGLTVHEAGARGTPSVTYNVEGLREVVIPGKNGLLSKTNTPGDMAKSVELLLSDKKKYEQMQQGAIEERKKFTWQATYNNFKSIIDND